MPPLLEDNMLRTLADDLLDLVKKSKRISVEEAAKKLKVSIASVQALVDFLVEEKIFGIEYTFTTPYIYPYKEGIKNAKGRGKSVTKELMTKEQFYEMSKQKNAPPEHIAGMWRQYLQQNLPQMKEEFFEKAREKKVPEEKIGELWKKYVSYL